MLSMKYHEITFYFASTIVTIGFQRIAAISQVCEGRQSRRTAKDRLGESACGADRGDRSRVETSVVRRKILLCLPRMV